VKNEELVIRNWRVARSDTSFLCRQESPGSFDVMDPRVKPEDDEDIVFLPLHGISDLHPRGGIFRQASKIP